MRGASPAVGGCGRLDRGFVDADADARQVLAGRDGGSDAGDVAAVGERPVELRALAGSRHSLRSQLEITLGEHEAVFDAIAAADPDAAEEAMRRHILDAWQRRRPPRADEATDAR